jgi:hypothetical protein
VLNGSGNEYFYLAEGDGGVSTARALDGSGRAIDQRNLTISAGARLGVPPGGLAVLSRAPTNRADRG